MGLLDSVAGALGSQRTAGGGDLLGAVIGMLANGSQVGGLAGLAERFRQGGLGDVVNSWIGSGENLPVSPGQLQDVLGSDVLSQLAQQFGIGSGDLAGQLSQLLPQAVDQATPGGRVPEGGLGDIGALLGRLR